ncbi:protein deglycase HchA, partial [Erwinia amylovora]|nr:protein deglycase HchA [Erwinia amylovora]
QKTDICYMPGNLTWQFGERLKDMDLTLVNVDISGSVNQDRKVFTGVSPFAAIALGKLAANALLQAFS